MEYIEHPCGCVEERDYWDDGSWLKYTARAARVCAFHRQEEKT